MRHLLLLLGLLFSGSSFATSPAEAVQRFLDGVHTLAGAFEQEQRDERGAVLQRSSGRMWLSRVRPGEARDLGRFRWLYDTPYQQLIISDGVTVWLYDADLAQVTLRDAQATLQGTPAQLLAQGSALADQFRIEDGGQKEGLQWVRLIPKQKDSDFQAVELALRDGLPVQMRFHDQLGGTSEVRFLDMRRNVALDPGLFRFQVPPGTEVIDTRGGAAP